jgi:hypothetical protein
VVTGDYNIAPDDRDVWDAETWRGQVLCTDEERSRFQSLLWWGLTDELRSVNDESSVYTQWDYRSAAFRFNQGVRIDHLLVSEPVRARMESVELSRDDRSLEAFDGDAGNVDWGETEDLAVEREFGFERGDDVFGAAEAVLFAFEGEVGVGEIVGLKGGDHLLGLSGGDDFVLKALEEDDCGADLVREVDGGARFVGGGGFGVGADHALEIA